MIIDDELLVRDLLEDNVRQIPFLQHVQSCKNALEAAEILHREKIDLLFLDIQMPRLNGLQLLQSLTDAPLVILVTAYEKYALEGFNLNVVDYMLKPFSFDRFLKACNRANELYRLRQLKTGPAPIQDFFVNVEYTQVKVVVADITYIESLKDYVRIHQTTAPPILTRMTIKALEEKLTPDSFVRTHKSYLVAIKKITAVKRDLVCIGKLEIPIGDAYKENVTRMIHPDDKL